MKYEYRELRLNQLGAALAAFDGTRQVVRPHRGWLRAVRQALGLSRPQVAKAMGVKPQSIMDFEETEAHDRITLRNLRRLADAMDCELVYAIVPKSGTIRELAERRLRNEATERVRAVEHTMALENQATGNLEEKVKDEVKRVKAGR
jgi:predicted DNA-binding mobile mystery protein A